MNWQTLDGLTRRALVVTVIAVIALVVPLIGVAVAIVALVLSAMALRRARAEGRENVVARNCLLIDTAIIVFLVVGNLVYSAAN